MTNARQALGAAGERLAAAHLESKGYEIMERNVRSAHGELDLVARSPEGVLVIVEVRTRRGADAEATVIEAVDQRKQRRLAELAGEYLAERPSAEDARIDVIAIAVGVDGRVLSVRHVENAVEA